MRVPSAFLPLLALIAACSSPPGAQVNSDGGTSSVSSASASGVVSASASTPGSTTPALSAPSASSTRNAWLACHEGFRAESTPRRDLMRLAMICGPSHGMKAVQPVVESSLKEGEFASIRVTLKKDECVRGLAAGDMGVIELELTIRKIENLIPTFPRSVSDTHARWAIAPEDGALCVSDPTVVEILVTMKRGAGQIALQPWVLP